MKFLDILIQKRRKRQNYRIFKINTSSSSKPQKIKIVVSKKRKISEEHFKEIAKLIEADLENQDLNYKDLTRLQIQLLLNIFSEEKIELRKTKSGALVIIR